MIYVVGLGNPGNKYRDTRHNVGFRIVDAIAEKSRISLKSGRGEYVHGQSRSGSFALAKPMTYMNNSGLAIQQILQHENVNLSELLVVYDDLDLPLGKLRFRPGGGAGTHRGMQSILGVIGTQDFPRVRIGINSDLKTGPAEDFVLAPFVREEKIVINEVISRAVDGIMDFIHNDIEFVMNTYNQIEVENL